MPTSFPAKEPWHFSELIPLALLDSGSSTRAELRREVTQRQADAIPKDMPAHGASTFGYWFAKLKDDGWVVGDSTLTLTAVGVGGAQDIRRRWSKGQTDP